MAKILKSRDSLGKRDLGKRLLHSLLLKPQKDEKVRVVTHAEHSEEIKGLTHRVPQLLSRSQKQWWDYLGKICEGASCLMESLDVYGSPLRILYQQQHFQFWLKGTERGRSERWLSEPQILQAGNRLIRLLSFKHMVSFMERKDGCEGGSAGPRGRAEKPS